MTTPLEVENNQNVQVKFQVTDFLTVAMGDSYAGHVALNFSLDYSDGSSSAIGIFECTRTCVDGAYDGDILVRNNRNDSATVHRSFKTRNHFF